MKNNIALVLLGSFSLLAATQTAPAQSNYEPYTFTTMAGLAGNQGSNDGTGDQARFSFPNAVAVDETNVVYVADTFNESVRKISPARVVQTLPNATFYNPYEEAHYPYAIAVDKSGNVYVTLNHTIRKITPGGTVEVFAGSDISGSEDGFKDAASFSSPQGIAVDRDGNVYVADTGNHTIRKITPDGFVNTVAGVAGSSGSTDGQTFARFNTPTGIAVNSQGTLFVTDRANYTVRRILDSGLVETIAGSAGSFGSADGTGAAARFANPTGIAVGELGDVFVTDTLTIRKIRPGGVVTTLAGSAENVAGSADGTGSEARFWAPAGIAVSSDGTGTLYVADTGNHTIRVGVPSRAAPAIEIAFDPPPGGGNVFRIGIDPRMPTITARARITGVEPNPGPNTTFTWKFEVNYDASKSPNGPSRVFNFTWPSQSGGEWTSSGPNFTTRFDDAAFDGAIFGGDLTATATATINGQLVTGTLRGFKILGYPDNSNEARATKPLIAAALGNSTLRKIANHESQASQFAADGYPKWSQRDKGGVGVMQLTKPAPSPVRGMELD